MAFPLYIALTAAEFSSTAALPCHPAWMACHFSSYGTGLSNCPKDLPEGAMLIVNDSTPVRFHDPGQIRDELLTLAEDFSPHGILLDLQRPGSAQTAAIVKILAEGFPCPVGVTEAYAADLDCPVFVSVPGHQRLTDAIARWQEREIWLEAATDAVSVTVTPQGSRSAPLHGFCSPGLCHSDPALHCHYTLSAGPEQAVFHIFRTEEDLQGLLQEAEALGVSRAIGLYQDLRSFPVESL